MVMEWVTGVKLTTLSPDEIRDMIKVGQEMFLTQLLDVGFIHGDAHPGNLLKVTDWSTQTDRHTHTHLHPARGHLTQTVHSSLANETIRIRECVCVVCVGYRGP